MKIRVLRIINRFNLGGPTYNATYLSAYLPDHFETKLVGGKHEQHEGASTFIPEQHGLEITIIEELQREIDLTNDKKAIKKLRQIIREFKPHIVHTHASKSGFIGRYAASKEKVPVIVHTFHGHVFHSYFGKLKTNLYKNIERRMAKKSDAIIVISKEQHQELVYDLKIVPEKKAEIIKLGFDLSRFQEELSSKRSSFRSEYGISEDVVSVGIIGRLTAIKNHDFFLNVAESVLSKTQQKVKFIIIGDGEEKARLEERARKIDGETDDTKIIFTSWIKEIDWALAGLDIVALASLNEGTPVSLIEAQAAGVPVITTNVGGVVDVVKENHTGFIIPKNDENLFVHKMLELINSKELREKMSQNGWNHVSKEFSYTRLCSDVEKLYMRLLKNKNIIE